jgi:peptidoglycan/LPS O-acetylase OafA/YrhL
MGLFRIFFAAIVFGAHLGLTNNTGLLLLNGTVAVKSFFIISGFYMSLILNEKYTGKNNSYFLFITNRLLRLYPLYWLILIISCFIYLPHLSEMIKITPSILPQVFSIPSFNTALFACKQITIFCDMDYLVKNTTGQFLFVGPAWSIGLEMLFYLLAPFFVKSSRKILILFLISLFFKFTWYHSALSESLIFFALGSVSYLIYVKIRSVNFHTKTITKILILIFVLAILIPYILLISNLNTNDLYQNILTVNYYLSFILVIPVTFLLTAKNRIDTFIGNFSYPIYLCHTTVLHILHRLQDANYILYVITAIVSVTVFSYLLIRFVENPIDAFRASRVVPIKKSLR